MVAGEDEGVAGQCQRCQGRGDLCVFYEGAEQPTNGYQNLDWRGESEKEDHGVVSVGLQWLCILVRVMVASKARQWSRGSQADG